MTIAQVSRAYDVSVYTLRYYERAGLLPHVTRTSGGVRDYTEEDCRWVAYIKCMRGAGVSVETLAEYVALFDQGDASIPARKALLKAQRAQLARRVEEMNAALDRLDRKIERYEELMVPCESALLQGEEAAREESYAD